MHNPYTPFPHSSWIFSPKPTIITWSILIYNNNYYCFFNRLLLFYFSLLYRQLNSFFYISLVYAFYVCLLSFGLVFVVFEKITCKNFDLIFCFLERVFTLWFWNIFLDPSAFKKIYFKKQVMNLSQRLKRNKNFSQFMAWYKFVLI